MKAVLIFIIVGLPVLTIAQGTLKAGTQVPLQYAVQYDYKFPGRWSVNVQEGVLTKPYDQIILDVLKGFGVEQDIINVLQNSFDFGLITQVGTNYHFKKNYFGVRVTWIHLRAADTPVEAVEKAYNVNVNSYPARPRQNTNSTTLTLQSDLYLAGLLYGRRFTFKNNPRVEIHTEVSFSKVFASTSYVDSEQRNLSALSTEINSELQQTYNDYGYVPTINVYFVYKLRKPQN